MNETSSVAAAASMSDLKNCCSLKRKRPPRIEIPSVLREDQADIVVGKWKGRDLLEEEDGFSGNGVAVLAVKGKKKFMEDAHRVVNLNREDFKKGFFGVYDGHGGKKAAEFVAENLHINILEMIENCSENCSKEEAIKAGFLKSDREFLDQGIGSGACCVTALIDENEIAVSNLGDCRAVLSRGGIAEPLTTDHRAECEDERERIQKEGGYVEFHRGAWRVHGILSVSRSIGDAHLKDWVLAEPETKIVELCSDMSYLILASDGLWDQVSNQEVVDIVMRTCSADKKLSSPNKLWNSLSDQYGTICTSPSPKIKRVSLLKPQDSFLESPTFRMKDDHIGIIDEAKQAQVTTPHTKPRRILSVVRTPKKTPQSPKSPSQENVNVNQSLHSVLQEEEVPVHEAESPPLKLRRMSAGRRTLGKLMSCPPNQENVSPLQPLSTSLGDACRELVNLAVRRGSMDDISVMIIDLSYFRTT